ncbi:hypothetical protein COV11_04490 [Candidatus Woesearchaeota archaeon CG10_big_fil_rev_8_21_14_0_10_30_7]|nr:MAG: hypothetical protein COV11_04490 [Candidatus Woesearchaeota archaeon CG10_big_fil_rev_8_21_14_0_10_30_7]
MPYFFFKMPVEMSLKSRILDKKDRQILMILQDNGRESLTNIAKKVGLSIDSVNNRIKAMQEKGIFSFGINIDPHAIGFNLIVDNKIKLHNITEEGRNKFIGFLKEHKSVIQVSSLMGDFDITCVIIAKNTDEYNNVTLEIRQKFSNLISDWRSVLLLKNYKFESYDLV